MKHKTCCRIWRILPGLLICLFVADSRLTAREASVAIATDDFDVDQLQARIYSTIEKVSPAVVWITGRGSACSGVIVSREGHILSAGHAIRSGARYNIRFADGRRLTATGMGSSTRLDCALLKINDSGDMPFVEMGDSKQLVENQPCLSLSFPVGQQNSPVVRFGRIINTLTRQGMIQSNAMMEPGDSGGPLFDLDGRVIGIHSRIGDKAEYNFDVPVDVFKKSWKQLNRAESFRGYNDPVLPKLGFEGESLNGRTGIKVLGLVDKGVAKEAGIEVDDLITAIEGNKVSSIRGIRDRLISAAKKDATKIEVTINREGETLTLDLPFDVRKPVDVPLPDYQSSRTRAPSPIHELANFAGHFAPIETQLDDNVITISSNFGKKKVRIWATLIADGRKIISKNSMIGDAPYFIKKGRRLALEVVTRDIENDLVLLRAPEAHEKGIQLTEPVDPSPTVGRFLLTPAPNGKGFVSVWSAPEFSSRKFASRGFLGVMLGNHAEKGALLAEVMEGAAEKAGLQSGDVVIQMNETRINSANDLRRFLSTVDPYRTVAAKVRRDEDVVEANIMLGIPPSDSNHAADLMAKSGRRDGFERVISHDADLEPGECGGPVYDLQGNFVGLNIARNSRVRSYAIPRRIIKSFVENN